MRVLKIGKKHIFPVLFIVVLLFCLAAREGLSSQIQPMATNYVEGDVIVTFKPTIGSSAAATALSNHSLGWQKHFKLLSQHQGRQIGLIHSKNKTTAQLIAELNKDPAVELAEPNYLRLVSSKIPNDADFSSMWALQNTGQTINNVTGTSGDDIRFVPAWGLARTSSTNSPVVAVIDTGVDYTHPDLAANIWINTAEIPNNGVDDDGDGYVDDYYGYDFADGASDPMDSGFHGTHLAGTIAAIGNNGLGVVGVDYEAKIMALRASSDGSYVTDAAVIEAIQYAIMKKEQRRQRCRDQRIIRRHRL